MLNVIVTNTTCKIEGKLDYSIVELLDEELSYDVSGACFSEKVQKGLWDGKRHLFSKNTFTFPIGLLSRVQTLLNEISLPYEIIDRRRVPISNNPINGKTSLWDWQEDIVKKCLEKERGIVKSPTGSGKRIILVNLAGRLNVRTMILVNKKDILYQTKKQYLKDLNIEPGQIGDGVVEPKEHTVAMIQTVANAFKIKTDDDDLEEKDKTRLTEQRINILKNAIFRTECMIGDECHGLVSKTWYSIQKYFTNVYYKFGFSATPAKTDKSDLLLEATFGPKIVDIPCTELINKGYLAKPIFYLIRFKHERIPRILSYQELYDQEIVCNENRNFLIVKLGTKFWKEGKRILIIVQQVKHGKILEEMFKITIGKENVRFIQGITKSEMRQRVLEDLNKGNIRLVIATKVFSEGIDCPEINVLMNVKCQISYVDFVQIIGRAMRKTENKDKTCIIDIYDYGCRYLERHSKERLSILKTEPEFDIRMIDESKI